MCEKLSYLWMVPQTEVVVIVAVSYSDENEFVVVWCVEPNLLSHTAHSISRKGVKKRDLSDVELRDILADILRHIRTDHVLPKDSEVLTNAIKRGLVSIPPSHMIGSDTIAVGGQSSASAWVRTRNMSLFVKPRLFVPYFDEVKVTYVLFSTVLNCN